MCTLFPLQEENEGEEDLLDQFSSVLSAVLKRHGDSAMPLVDTLLPSLAPLLDPQRTPEERRVAICILDDILEFSPAGARALRAALRVAVARTDHQARCSAPHLNLPPCAPAPATPLCTPRALCGLSSSNVTACSSSAAEQWGAGVETSRRVLSHSNYVQVRPST